MQKIEFIYTVGSQNPLSLWGGIAQNLMKTEINEFFLFYGKKVKSSKIADEIKRLKVAAFNIESKNFRFHLATVSNYHQISLQVEIKTASERDWWSDWVDKLVFLDGFVQAWLADSEYDFWQNATDPIEYESKGKSYLGLPMKSNGLPPPLDQLEIDTSKNPGLRKLCDGYVESIGSHMWISRKFLNLVGKTVDDIESFEELSVNRLPSGIFHIDSKVEIFKDSSTEKEQKRLRYALYSLI